MAKVSQNIFATTAISAYAFAKHASNAADCHIIKTESHFHVALNSLQNPIFAAHHVIEGRAHLENAKALHEIAKYLLSQLKGS